MAAAAAESQQNNKKSNNNKEEKLCRICHGTDEEEDSISRLINYISSEWVHPCKCSGSIKWVHRACFKAWHDQASAQQRKQCSICSYVFCFSPHPKPQLYTELNTDQWGVILMCAYAIFKLFCFIATLNWNGINFCTLAIIFCWMLIFKERELQLQLLREHELQVMLENTGHYTGAGPNQSVFEESIDDAV